MAWDEELIEQIKLLLQKCNSAIDELYQITQKTHQEHLEKYSVMKFSELMELQYKKQIQIVKDSLPVDIKHQYLQNTLPQNVSVKKTRKI